MQYTIDRRRDLSRPGEQSELWPHALLVQGDEDAALWRVRVTDGGQAIDLTGTTIKAQVIRQSGVTVEITGSASGSVASVTLDKNCFAEGGEITCRMIAEGDGSKVTLDLIRIPVRTFSVGRILDPEERLPSLPDLLAQLSRLEGAIDAALALTDTPAYIGANGNWYVFDQDAQAYVDSGVAARGPTGASGAPGVAADNLLDNSYFARPVNQRGQTSYTAEGYGIDRWIVGAGALLTIDKDASITLAATGSQAATLTQRLPGDVCTRLTGKAATIAVYLTDGTLLCASGTVTAGTQAATLLTKSSGNRSIRLSRTSSGALEMVIAAPASGSVSVCWAALYEGAYTADALPSYRPRAAALELLECQRYYYAIRCTGATEHIGDGSVNSGGTMAYVLLHLSVPMRAMPSMAYANLEVWSGAIGHVEVSALERYAIDEAWQNMTLVATLKSTVSGGGAGILSTRAEGTGYLELSAEL